MKIKEITAAIESHAPLATQESYDNSGLVVGDPEAAVDSALICVDITEAVIDEAEELGVKLIISHHPVIFNPIKRLTGATNVEKLVARAIRAGIALYASHTNLDVALGGLSHRLAETIGLQNTKILSPSKEENTGFGVIGNLPKPCPTEEFLKEVAQKLKIKAIRHSAPATEKVTKIAICSGSGASLIETAQAAGADLYLAADFKYNNFLDAAGRITIADIGHFESEYCAIEVLFDIITKKFPIFALHKSRSAANPVNYLVTI